MLTQIGIAIAALVTMYFALKLLRIVLVRRQREKALNGKHGIESRWAAELDEQGDQMFIMAANSLPDMELKEIGIVAESKEELRELTIERFEEMMNEKIPEDFA